MNVQSHHLMLSDRALLRSLAGNWWLVLLRGIAALVLGVLAFAMPGMTLLTLVLLWGAYTFVDGAIALGAAIMGPSGTMAPRWWLALTGLAGLIAGAMALFVPGVTAAVLLIFLAVWAIFIGVMEICGAIALRKEIDNEWYLILAGLLAVGFGALLLLLPAAGAVAIAWTVGSFALLSGVVLIGLSLRLRKLHRGD